MRSVEKKIRIGRSSWHRIVSRASPIPRVAFSFSTKKRCRARFRSKTMARRRRVAVLVDDSPGSMRACRYGAKHLLDKDTDVMLVTAVHDSADTPAVRTASLGTSETPKARETRPLLHSDRSRTFGFSSFFTDARRACDRRFTHARFSSPSSVGPAEKKRSIRSIEHPPTRSHRSRPLRKASACASTTPRSSWVATSPPSASRR